MDKEDNNLQHIGITLPNDHQVFGEGPIKLLVDPKFVISERWQATNILAQASVARDAGNGMAYPEMTTVQLWVSHSGKQEWRELPVVEMGACLRPLASSQQAWEVIPGSLKV